LIFQEDVFTENKENFVATEEIKTEPSFEKIKADEDENLYYYEEPENKNEEVKKEENGFTSIKDELKEKRKWEIPQSVKKGAEEIINNN
jgi:hypothetical protein